MSFLIFLVVGALTVFAVWKFALKKNNTPSAPITRGGGGGGGTPNVDNPRNIDGTVDSKDIHAS
jgi:hypothetical protein